LPYRPGVALVLHANPRSSNAQKVRFLLAELELPHRLRLPLDLLRLTEDVDENGYLRPQHQRHDRLDQIIDGAEGVSSEHLRVRAFTGGEENDRRVRRPPPLANQLRRLEPVHPRHVDVHQDQGEILIEQPA